MIPLAPLWAFARSRLGLGLFAALAMGLLWLRGSHYRNQRDDLRAWQSDVVSATRNAAHRPNLAIDQVALQVTNLGLSLDRIVEAQEAARLAALAAKEAQERRDEENRRKHDEALPTRLAEARRRADAYFDAHRLRGSESPAPAAGGVSASDLPSPAFGPQEPDGGGGDADMAAITHADFERCTVNSERLRDGVEWVRDAGLAGEDRESRAAR